MDNNEKSGKTVTSGFLTFYVPFLFLTVFIMFVYYTWLFRETTEDADSQGDASSQPDTISIASRTSQNTVDSDKVKAKLSSPRDVFVTALEIIKLFSRNNFTLHSNEKKKHCI